MPVGCHDAPGLLPRQDLLDVLERVGNAWQDLRDARLFITGGTGFLGQWLLSSLSLANAELGLNARACVLTRDPARFAARAPRLLSDPMVTTCSGDVRSFEFPDGEFTHIIHAATDTSQLAGQQPYELIDTMVAGTRRVLELARERHTRRFLYLSSGAVYGGATPPAAIGIREESDDACDPLDPATSYGQAKRLAEHLCALTDSASDVDCVIARCFACVGPLLPLDTHFAIGNFIRDALWEDGIHVRGSGTPLRSYLYAGDLTVWLWRLLVNGRGGRAYNVGSDEPISIVDLARRVSSILAPGKPVLISDPTAASGARDRYVPCVERARRELGLIAWTPLDEAIRKTARFAMTGWAGEERNS